MKYDAIVIGAGNGGLVAALTLQKKGKKVLVLEEGIRPGGVASSFILGRFEFERSLQTFIGYGCEEQHGKIYDLFKRLGIVSKVNFQKISEVLHVLTINTHEEYSFPCELEKFILKMEEYVKGSSDSMIHFFQLASEMDQALTDISNHEDFDYAELALKYPNFAKYGNATLESVLQEIKMPKKTQEILSSFWYYFASPSKEISFVSFAVIFYSLVLNGLWIPEMRSSDISRALESELESAGGKIKFLSKVNKVLIKDNQAVGVLCSDGKEYFADYFICNISPHIFYGSLLPNFSEKAKQLCNARLLGGRGICVYLGLNQSANELGLHHYQYSICYNLDSNLEFQKKKELYHESCMATVIKENTSNDTCILMLTSFYPYDVLTKISKEKYFEVQEGIAETLIKGFERAVGISIKHAIEEIKIATPVTFSKSFGYPEGAIYGYMAKGYDNIVPRILGEKEEKILSNVRFCGGYGSYLAGYYASYLSGERAALKTLKDMEEGRIDG